MKAIHDKINFFETAIVSYNKNYLNVLEKIKDVCATANEIRVINKIPPARPIFEGMKFWWCRPQLDRWLS